MNTTPDPPPALSDEQIECFLEKGHVMVRGAVATDVIEAWVALAFKRLGYDRNDPATWSEPIVRMPQMNKRLVREIAPFAHRAICQLMGGEERLLNPEIAWGDGFAANFSNGADRPWCPPSARATGWHKDGDFSGTFSTAPSRAFCVSSYTRTFFPAVAALLSLAIP